MIPMWNHLITYSFRPKIFVRAAGGGEAEKAAPSGGQSGHESGTKEQGDEVKRFYEDVVINSEPSATKARTSKKKKTTRSRVVVTSKDRETRRTPITRASLFRAAQIDDVQLLREHFEEDSDGANDIDVRDEYGWSLLMTAACAGSAEVVRFLLSKAAPIDSCDRAGNTALRLAAAKRHEEVIDVLSRPKQGTEPKEITPEKISSDVSASEFYCDDCEITVRDSSEIRHKSSTVHQIRASSPSDVRTIYGIPEANRGFQMMLHGGWNRDKGLGPSGEGKKFPVKTVLKRDRQGVGAEGANLARVTHFLPNDPASVLSRSRRERIKGSSGRTERAATISKRQRDRSKRGGTAKEKLLRQELCGL